MLNSLNRLRALTNNADDKDRLVAQFFLHAPVMLFVVQGDKFAVASAYASTVLGYTNEELTTQSFYDFIVEEDHEKSRASGDEWEASWDAAWTDKFINRYRTKDGRVLVLEWTGNGHNSDGIACCYARVIGEETNGENAD